MTQEKIEIPFGAYDSELKGWEYTIPEGMEATIENGKVIVRRRESENESHRKWILEYLYDGLRKAHEQVKEQFKSAIAWLEKWKDFNDMEFYEGYTLGFDDGMKSVEQKEQKPVDLVAELKLHLANTPKEQLEKEWKELEPYGNIGPTVHEFLYGEQPAEWSEEDEKALERAIDCVRSWEIDYCDCDNKISERLKSLRPSWKPTEEQLKALQMVRDSHCFMYQQERIAIETLLNQLKSL